MVNITNIGHLLCPHTCDSPIGQVLSIPHLTEKRLSVRYFQPLVQHHTGVKPRPSKFRAHAPSQSQERSAGSTGWHFNLYHRNPRGKPRISGFTRKEMAQPWSPKCQALCWLPGTQRYLRCPFYPGVGRVLCKQCPQGFDWGAGGSCLGNSGTSEDPGWRFPRRDAIWNGSGRVSRDLPGEQERLEQCLETGHSLVVQGTCVDVWRYLWWSRLGWGVCWHLVGRGQGCWETSCNAQDSPHEEELTCPKQQWCCVEEPWARGEGHSWAGMSPCKAATHAYSVHPLSLWLHCWPSGLLAAILPPPPTRIVSLSLSFLNIKAL